MKTLREHLEVWLKGHTPAVDFIMAVHEIAETWDDLIDKDKVSTETEINAAFYAALITLPRNPFYQQHFHELSPIVESAILDWHTANALEKRKTGDDLHRAFMLRNGPLAITIMAARIINGLEWAQHVSLEFYSLVESWADYSNNIRSA